MSTTLTEPEIQDEALVAQREASVLFLARRRELRLIIDSAYPILDASTGRVTGKMTPSHVVAFKDGRLVVPAEGTFIFEDGSKGDAGEVLAWLKDHRLHDDTGEGFWSVDPTAPAPTMAEIERIVEAAQNADRERLEAIIAQEAAGWQRETILSVAKGSLVRLDEQDELIRQHEEMKAQEAAQAAAEAAVAARESAQQPAEPNDAAEPQTEE